MCVSLALAWVHAPGGDHDPGEVEGQSVDSMQCIACLLLKCCPNIVTGLCALAIVLCACVEGKCGGWGFTWGLPEPSMINLAGWMMLTPSRSTVLSPLAALSSTTSTRPSSNRFTSSTYRIPLLALACSTVRATFSRHTHHRKSNMIMVDDTQLVALAYMSPCCQQITTQNGAWRSFLEW